MGIVQIQVAFDGKLPTLEAIVETLERVTGLAAQAEDTEADELHSMRARLAFRCDPSEDVEVYAYRAGAVRAACEEVMPDVPWLTAAVEGVHEIPGRQAIYVQGYVGQETTLLVAMEQTLESLGGVPQRPRSLIDREDFRVRITPEELARRRAKNRRQGYWMMALVVPLNLLALPFLWLWWALTLPWGLWRAYRVVKSRRSPVNPD